ncbi:MAG: phosphoribosyl-AMP cyclohydrolase [Rhodospirillaceae bacterium]|jgi:phosphoribosyl-AMP cyclohydrolase|nr:phosphoribosyl-AMP cyclohydrolase [Rhodospirillaceae bacterium]
MIDLKFNSDGLIPVIVQQHDTGEVLMMSWMNKTAITETLNGNVCYYSRTRKSLWYKGESSGQIQTLVSFLIDCDRDTILLKVDQKGVACHTGHHNCFFTEIKHDEEVEISKVLISPEELYDAP